VQQRRCRKSSLVHDVTRELHKRHRSVCCGKFRALHGGEVCCRLNERRTGERRVLRRQRGGELATPNRVTRHFGTEVSTLPILPYLSFFFLPPLASPGIGIIIIVIVIIINIIVSLCLFIQESYSNRIIEEEFLVSLVYALLSCRVFEATEVI